MFKYAIILLIVTQTNCESTDVLFIGIMNQLDIITSNINKNFAFSHREKLSEMIHKVKSVSYTKYLNIKPISILKECEKSLIEDYCILSTDDAFKYCQDVDECVGVVYTTMLSWYKWYVEKNILQLNPAQIIIGDNSIVKTNNKDWICFVKNDVDVIDYSEPVIGKIAING